MPYALVKTAPEHETFLFSAFTCYVALRMAQPDALEALDERALRMIVRGTLAFTGEELFQSLVRHLSELLGAKIAVVGEVRPGDPGRVHTRAFWCDGDLAPNIQYDLADTPCDHVVSTGSCYFTQGIQTHFPTDLWLVQVNAQSYFGTDLVGTTGDDAGKVIGVLCVVHDRPLTDTPATRSVFSIFATRAAAELARLRADARARDRADALLRTRSALLRLAQRDDSDLRNALRAIVETDAHTMDVERVCYRAFTDDRTELECKTLYMRATGTFAHEPALRYADAPTYFETISSGRAIIADDTRADHWMRELWVDRCAPLGITSKLDVPVWYRGQLAGVVCHEHVGGPRAWSTVEQDFAVAIAGLISLSLEASERRRAEERYRLAARTTNDVIWDWNLATNSLEWSDGFSAMFRYEQQQVGNTIDWWASRIHPDDHTRVTESIEKAVAGTESVWSEEYRFLRGDGSIAIVIDRGSIARDDQGQAVRMVGAMLDVTERRRLEARVLVTDRMASLGTLSAGIAHEINNPLAYILANLDYALEELERRSTFGDVMAGLREARGGAWRVSEIVRNLKTFSRGDEGPRQAIEVVPVVESAINMAWNEIRHRSRLVRDFRAIPPVDASEARLGQVVLNLLVNAAQAISEGNTAHHEIRVITDTDARGSAVIEVRDNGPGIAPEIRNRIFDPFFTTKQVGGGTGLGLSICHSIVAEFGGEITADCAPDGGCVMRVVLPPASVGPATPCVVTPIRLPATRPCVLVVDDDPHVGAGIRRMLAKECEIAIVTSAREALARIASGARADVILCDLMMPDMPGMELYAELERIDPNRASTMIFMTGGAFSAGAREFLARVPRPHVEKPFTIETIRQQIRSILDTRI
jgi:PAS domain S-box-containing protein